MINMLAALWDLLRSSVICLAKGIVGLVMVATMVGLPIFITGAIWEAFCIIFAFEFSWWIPIIVLVLSICFIVTGEEGSLLDEMFEELIDSKSGTVRKETKEMGMNCVKADNDVRLKMAKAAVVAWYNEHNAPSKIGLEDVYIVWFCKVLQNWKALAGTHHGDGMYYEVTYDGDKDAAYVDAYKKWQNVQMTGSKLRNGVC